MLADLTEQEFPDYGGFYLWQAIHRPDDQAGRFGERVEWVRRDLAQREDALDVKSLRRNDKIDVAQRDVNPRIEAFDANIDQQLTHLQPRQGDRG